MTRRANGEGKLRTRIAYGVAALWFAQVVLTMIPPLGYEPSPRVHTLMLIVAGHLFVSGAAAQIRSRNGGED